MGQFSKILLIVHTQYHRGPWTVDQAQKEIVIVAPATFASFICLYISTPFSSLCFALSYPFSYHFINHMMSLSFVHQTVCIVFLLTEFFVPLSLLNISCWFSHFLLLPLSHFALFTIMFTTHYFHFWSLPIIFFQHDPHYIYRPITSIGVRKLAFKVEYHANENILENSEKIAYVGLSSMYPIKENNLTMLV